MPDVENNLIALAPFAGLGIRGAKDRGVIATGRDGLGIATVMLRKDKKEVLAQRLKEHYALELPRGPRRSAADDLSMLGTGMGIWLALQERGGNAFASSLAEKVGDAASISDQSDGYAVLRVSGPKVLDALAKLFPIDLHPRIFEPGHVVSTVAGHMSTILWRLEDGASGSAMFEIAVFRSLAENFLRMLSESAAEFGMVLEQTSR